MVFYPSHFLTHVQYGLAIEWSWSVHETGSRFFQILVNTNCAIVLKTAVDGYSNGSYFIPLMAPPHGKKRKLSGLSSLELQLAFNAVLQLSKSFIYIEEEGATNQEGEQDSFEGRVFDILALFKSRLEEPQV